MGKRKHHKFKKPEEEGLKKQAEKKTEVVVAGGSIKEEPKEIREICWRAAEFDYKDKDVSWFWITGLAMTILAMIALWQKNFFFFVFLVLAGIMVLIFGKKRPRVFDFKIDEKGVHVGDMNFYPFKDLVGFDINVRPGRLDEVVFRRHSYMDAILKLPADSKTAEKAGSFLLGKVKKFKYEETLVELIADLLGF